MKIKWQSSPVGSCLWVQDSTGSHKEAVFSSLRVMINVGGGTGDRWKESDLISGLNSGDQAHVKRN